MVAMLPTSHTERNEKKQQQTQTVTRFGFSPTQSRNFLWNKTTSQWQKNGSSVYEYAGKDRLTFEESFNKDSLPLYRTTNRYTADGKQTYSFEEYYQNAQWYPNLFESDTFTADNESLVFTHINWLDSGSNPLVATYRDSVAYDENKVKIADYFFTKDYQNDPWKLDEKVFFTYDTNGYLTKKTHLHFNDSLKEFVPSRLDSLLLDKNGIDTTEIYYDWNITEKKWENYIQSINRVWDSYNPKTGKGVLNFYIGQEWDGLQWVNSSKGVFKNFNYDSYIRTYYKYENNQWVLDNRVSVFNNSTNDNIGNTYENWIDSVWVVYYKDTTFMSFDDLNQILTETYQVWDDASKELVNDSKKEYYNFWTVGINHHTNSPIISVFPNPTSDKITISIKDMPETAIQVELQDVLGKTIIKTNSEIVHDTYLKTLDLSDLPRGVYLLVVWNGEQCIVQKLCKE